MITRFVLALILTAVLPATAEISTLLPFQGRVLDSGGQPVSDGTQVIQFKLFDAPVGGRAVWSGEVQKLTVNGGMISTILGSKAALSAVDFAQPLYLELTLDANRDGQISLVDPPLLPRQSVISPIFAQEAGDSRALSGHDWRPLFGVNSPEGPIRSDKIAEGSIQAGKLAPGSITSAQIAPQAIQGQNLALRSIEASHVSPASLTTNELAQAVLDLLVPPGSVMAYAGSTNTLPRGWLLCDGRPLSSVSYPRLFASISTNWGAGIANSVNDFNAPDLRGLFLRGMNHGRNDGYQDLEEGRRGRSVPVGNQNTGGNPAGNSGAQVGSSQQSLLPTHIHNWAYSTSGDEFTRQLRSWNVDGSSVVVLADYGQKHIQDGANQQEDNFKEVTPGRNNYDLYTFPGSGSKITGGQVAPPNAYVNYIIKF